MRLFFCFIFLSQSVAAQSVVSFSSGGAAYVAKPNGKTSAAVILLHDRYGMDGWTTSLCDSLAREGIFALGVDLYRGKVPEDFMEAHEIERALPDAQARADIDAAIAYIKKNFSSVKKIAAAGWGMGGGYALETVMRHDDFAAVAVAYAPIFESDERVRKLKTPLLGNFAGGDVGIDSARVAKFRERLKTLGNTADVKIYPSLKQDFMRPFKENISDTFNAEAAEDAWKRIVWFLRTFLNS